MAANCEWCTKARELGGNLCRPCYRMMNVAQKVNTHKVCPCCKRKPHSERKATFIQMSQQSMFSGLNSTSYWWIKLDNKGKKANAARR